MLSDTSNELLVLCECSGTVTDSNVPPEIPPEEGVKAWPIYIVPEERDVNDEFNAKLHALLQAEGKSMGDMRALFSEPEPAPSSAESIIRAVGDLLDKTSKPPSESRGYRRLRTFSGTVPTPAGEESFDHWMEQAYLMVEESDCAPKEKRRRIMESLKGQALEVVRAVRLSEPDITPEKCSEALESAFGLAESGDDLYFAFRLQRQQYGEKLSDFLRQLERTLSKVVQRGGLPASNMDRARVVQLLKGAVDADLMMIQLRLRERRDNPPTFLDLLREIRTEEEYEASRAKLTQSTVRSAKPDNNLSEIQSLRAEIKEIKSMFAALATDPHQVKEGRGEKPAPVTEARHDPEVVTLRKQVQHLTQKMNLKQFHATATQSTVMAVGSTPTVPNTPTRPAADSKEYICYRCGESGHVTARCKNPENQSKVIQKLIGALKNGQSNNSVFPSCY
ncbi:paraneoplastic antigen Ma1 homolog [Lampris incognitus]|uniref:paraneoplastic antigen Ma1 homolog n=1 Tax=Lampris incognitus TaxID=2546036 RepID=UPI0024B4A32C|nr:paraneoplastic antigen Ma1 homolog [Lampris incognitus]XP_056157658.1 paraneoplastic antigen Ma1 homolog [Lampris incognitus]